MAPPERDEPTDEASEPQDADSHEPIEPPVDDADAGDPVAAADDVDEEVPAEIGSGDDPKPERSDPDAPVSSDSRFAPWRRTVPIPRWMVASGLAAIAVLLIATIAAASIALTQPEDGDAAADEEPGPVTIHDEFGRSGATLGTANSGQEWEQVEGHWAATVLGAQVVATDGDLTSLAVIDLEDTDGSVRMRAAKVVDGMGLVVRYRNPSNYIAVVAARTYATWTVRQVVNGQPTDLGTIGLAEADDNTSVDVRLRGDSIDVYVDGSYQASFTNPADPRATRVGMIATPGVTGGRWAVFDAQNAAALTQGLVPASSVPTTLG